MFTLLRMGLNMSSPITTKEYAVKASMKPGPSALADMTQARLGLLRKCKEFLKGIN